MATNCLNAKNRADALSQHLQRLLLKTQKSLSRAGLFRGRGCLYFDRTTQNLHSKKVFEMSSSMGMASVFALSSLLLSPLAMAEESPAFVAQNAARAAAFEQHQKELTANHQHEAKPQQTQVKASDSDDVKDS